jgi:putative ABC transport system substrate-binding protein
MKRRVFLAGVGSSLAFPSVLRAQAPREVRRIGYLGSEIDPNLPPEEYLSSKALRKLGWIEGKNLVVERRFGNLKTETLAGLAQELVRMRVDLIITNGPMATLAAARAIQNIPIVFINVTWPVETGLIDSFARPGRNLTGASSFTGTEVGAKRLELLREIAPSAKRLLQLFETEHGETLSGKSSSPGRGAGGGWIEATKRLGYESREVPVRKVADVEKGLADAIAWGAHAINGSGGWYLFPVRNRIAEFAVQHRLPTVFFSQSMVEAGGLLSYGTPPEESNAMLERAVEYVDRILRGAKPADLPVQRPSRYALTINLKTAKAIGVTIPQSILVRADRLIE